jgi:hypothetical protein
MTNDNNSAMIWRWLATASLLINVAFNYYTTVDPINNQTQGEVSGMYPTLITPAGYAFSIWGLIYLSLIIYSIYQLLPDQRKQPVYDVLAWPLIIINLLSIAWLYVFAYEYMGISVIVISCMLITAVLLFGWSKEGVRVERISKWVTVPFALYASWLSVATIVNIAVWLKHTVGWSGGPQGEEFTTAIMIGVALILGIMVSLRFRDIVFPLVIAWALIAIWVAREDQAEIVSNAALAAGTTAGLWALWWGYRLYKKPVNREGVAESKR